MRGHSRNLSSEKFSPQGDNQLLLLPLRTSKLRFIPNQQAKEPHTFKLVGNDGLSQNEDPGASAGGTAEGKSCHGGVLDGEEVLEGHFYSLRNVKDF